MFYDFVCLRCLAMQQQQSLSLVDLFYGELSMLFQERNFKLLKVLSKNLWHFE